MSAAHVCIVLSACTESSRSRLKKFPSNLLCNYMPERAVQSLVQTGGHVCCSQVQVM